MYRRRCSGPACRLGAHYYKHLSTACFCWRINRVADDWPLADTACRSMLDRPPRRFGVRKALWVTGLIVRVFVVICVYVVISPILCRISALFPNEVTNPFPSSLPSVVFLTRKSRGGWSAMGWLAFFLVRKFDMFDLSLLELYLDAYSRWVIILWIVDSL